MIIATAIRIILLKMYGCGHQVRASLRSTIVPIEMCGDASLFAVTAVEPQDVREAETRTSVSRYTILATPHFILKLTPFLRENLHGRSATRSRYDQMGPVSISASLITVLHRISLRGLQS